MSGGFDLSGEIDLENVENTDRPQVADNGAEWDTDRVTNTDPATLEPHPKNADIYGDTETVADLPETFVNSIREKGVLEPLVVTGDGRIISGHRRWLAAKHVGLSSVPVRRTAFDSDLAEREALLEYNRQREKTPGQLVNEYEEALEIEKERAKERQSEYHGNQHERTSGNVSKSADDDGSARDKAAEKIDADVSGRTLDKGLEVKQKADDGDETAKEAWDDLKDGDESFHGAYTTVKDAETTADTDEDTNGDIDLFTSDETDEWSSPRELVEPLADTLDGFDLDPCSGAETSPFADETYTAEDDGLAQDWFGTVWVNPPYSEMSDWTAKAIAESKRDETDAIYYLCKGDSSTEWWHDALEASALVVAIDHRLSFGDGGNSAPFASHIFVFGTPSDETLRELNRHGAVLSHLQIDSGGESE